VAQVKNFFPYMKMICRKKSCNSITILYSYMIRNRQTAQSPRHCEELRYGGMTDFRIANAYIHDCRTANSAGRSSAQSSGYAERGREQVPQGRHFINRMRELTDSHAALSSARRRLQPASYIKAKLLLCTLGYAERKILARRRLQLTSPPPPRSA
jgi:hypothetical protein